MTSTSADPRPTQVAFFGHAGGRRADGLTTYSADVVSGLLGQGVTVFFHHSAQDGSLTPTDQEHSLAWPTWRFKTVTLTGLGFRGAAERWLDDWRPQVLHTSLSFSLDDGWLGQRAAAKGIASVATFHLPFGRAGSGRARVMHRLHRFWARRLGAYQRVIVFSDEHRLRLAASGVSLGRIVVLPNAVDTERFSPGRSELRRERLPGAELVVGFAGRLDAEKGVRELLRGFEEAELGDGARLLLAGEGSLEGLVRATARRDRRIVYLGPISGAPARADFWRAVDVFCLPSSAEGLSLALLEAMASGCAVAATGAGGAAEMGEGAVRLEERQLVQSLATVLRAWLHDPEERVRQGTLARARVVRHHGVAAMLGRLRALYGECREELGRRRRPEV